MSRGNKVGLSIFIFFFAAFLSLCGFLVKTQWWDYRNIHNVTLVDKWTIPAGSCLTCVSWPQYRLEFYGCNEHNKCKNIVEEVDRTSYDSWNIGDTGSI